MSKQREQSTSSVKCCTNSLKETVQGTPGLLGAEVQRSTGQVKVAFDASELTDFEARLAAERLRPAVHQLLGKCVFRLRGRGREACADKLAYQLESRPGVRAATASYLGGAMTVSFDTRATSPDSVLHEARGLGAAVEPLREALAHAQARAEAAGQSWLIRLKHWFSDGHGLDVILVVLTLLFMVLGAVNSGTSATWLFLLAYLLGGYNGVQHAWHSLRQRIVDVDLLMLLAALGAAAIGSPFEGALLLFLFSLSNVLQDLAMARSRQAIEGLAKMRPATARVLRQGQAQEVPLAEVAVGEQFLLRPGDRAPLDGLVAEGQSSVDESSVTGESLPVDKAPGSPVYAGTFNQFGSLTVRVTRSAEDSTLARMIQLVEEAQSQKAKTQRFLDHAEQRYAIGVILFTGLLMLALPLVFGVSWTDGFYRAITVMVVASPCALVISTPASILSAIANGARRGILFKGGACLEQAAQIEVVALDKTGTLTQGQPSLVDLYPLGNDNRDQTLAAVAAVENKSEHPLAQAIVKAAHEQGLVLPQVADFRAHAGRGAQGRVEGRNLAVGSERWARDLPGAAPATEALAEPLAQAEHTGGTAIVAAWLHADGTFDGWAGVLVLKDTLRPEARDLVRQLKQAGVRRVAMLTGDSQRVAQTVAAEIGLDDVYAELLPEDKVHLMRKLSQGQGVAMVGDGTNDAPALASATVGIAMGAAGSDVALESADVVLMSNDLKRVPYLIQLSRTARAIILQNLSFAGGIILFMVLATLLLPLIGIEVPLPIGVLAHEGGTVLVCLNGLRLLWFKGP